MEVKILIAKKCEDAFFECVGLYESMSVIKVYEKNETLLFCIEYNDKYLFGDDLFELGRIFQMKISE